MMSPAGRRWPVSTLKRDWPRWWGQVKGLARNFHVWLVVLSLGAAATLHYVGLDRGHLVNILLPNLPAPLSRHSVERVLLVFPAVYAGFVFGIRGGMRTLLVAVVIMLPRAVFISPHPLDATLETAMVAVVGGVVVWMAEVQERERRLRERTLAEMEVLYSISTAAVQSLELQEVLDGSLERIARVMGAEMAWVYLLDEKAKELYFAGHYGLPERLQAGADRLAVGEGLNGRVVQTGEPLALADLSADPRLTREVVRSEGVQGFLAVPLKSKDRIMGTLGVGMYYPRHFRSDEVRLLSTIGNQIGVAIENVRLYEQEREAAAQLRASEESLRFYVRQITRAQETERLRIARDLHDETAQALVFLSRRLSALGEFEGQAPEALAGRLEEVHEMVDAVLRDVRRITQDLRPSTLDHLGLIPALRGLLSDVFADGGIRGEIEVVGEEKRLPPEVELVLFRIAQEALNNIRRHSGASEVTATVEFGDGEIGMIVRDDGKGFVMPERVGDLAAQGKLGLLGMYERARLVGGTVNIRSELGKGTQVEVSVPSIPLRNGVDSG